MKKIKPLYIALLVIFLILLIDQSLKFWVKTNMHLGEEIHLIGKYIMIHFTENPGMAFGMELGGTWGKLVLSIFRIIATILLSIYLHKILKEKTHIIYVIVISMVLAGAVGNLIDSAFYGLIFSESTLFQVATIFPQEGGYTNFLYGNVVDMLYCPIIQNSAGNAIFFRPVFNVADSSITIAVFLMIIFYKRIFNSFKTKEQKELLKEHNEIS